MKSMLRTIISLFFLAGWGLAALALHVVRLPEGFVGMVPKDHLTLTDTYLDVRLWTPIDVSQHPDFVRRLVSADRADWLKHVTDPAKGNASGQLIEMLTAPPAPASASTQPVPARGKAVANPGRAR